MELSERVAELLAAPEVEELTGGYQARVFRVVDRDGIPSVAKVLDVSLVNRVDVEARIDAVAALAELDPRVCRPLRIGSRLVTDIAIDDSHAGLITCYEYAEGIPPDVADAADASRMGRALAELHVAMSRLPPTRLPPAAALRTATASRAGQRQLLHGDFNAGNLRQLDGTIRIFDLDDCGYGPPAFDVANALYMVLFDAFVAHAPEVYRPFREAFVAGYCDAAGHRLDDGELNRFVEVRTAALEAWLDDPSSAPIGIRTATPAWRQFLRSFVSGRGHLAR